MANTANYAVYLSVEGRFRADVAASSPEEALAKANEMASETDFGSLEDIEWSAVRIEDDTGRDIELPDDS